MSEVIFKAINLRKYFPLRRTLREIFTLAPRRYVRAVDDISFDIKLGEVFCLVGESGCGKTTTGRLITRLLEPTGGVMLYKPTKEILKEIPDEFLDEDGYVDLARRLPKNIDRLLRREIQIVFQDPFSSLDPRMTVYDTLEEPLRIHKVGASEEERKEIIYKALSEVKLTPPEEFAHRYPHMLSGGQRQRVSFARAMILKPTLVVTDEPVSMLDVSIRAEILQLMLDLQTKRNLSYVFITHDLAVANYLCTRIAVMYLGKIVELGLTEKVVDNALHPYTKALLTAVPEPDPSNRLKFRNVPIKGEVPSAANVPPGCRFHPRCPHAMEICSKKEPPLVKVEADHYTACWLYHKH